MRYWIKLYTEILNDPKMGRLTDRQFRTCISLFAMAGILDRNGELPPCEDMAWQLRMTAEVLETDLKILQGVGIIDLKDDGIWYVRKWQERQSRAPSASRENVTQRVHDYRERQRNETVTTLHPQLKRGVTPPETETETETETEKNRKDNNNPPLLSLSVSSSLSPKESHVRSMLQERLGELTDEDEALIPSLARYYHEQDIAAAVDVAKGSKKHARYALGVLLNWRRDGKIGYAGNGAGDDGYKELPY